MPQMVPVPCWSREALTQPRRWRVALLVGLALSVGVSLGAQAATTWTVCASGCDYTSIKSAIAAPTTVDGDTLAIAAGTYTEAGIVVNKSLTLQGERAATTIVQAAATKNTASDRVFTVPAGITVTLYELTIRYGRTTGAGGGLFNQGTLTLTNSVVSGNTAAFGGGLDNRGPLTLMNSTVSGNTAVGGGGIAAVGGGFYTAFGGTVTLTNSTVSGNTAGSGGGFYIPDGTVTLANSTVSGNTAGSGGGLYTGFSGTVTLANSTVSGNTAGSGAGFYSLDTVILTHSIVAKNPGGSDCRNSIQHGCCIGRTVSQGYNLDSDGSCELTAPTDQSGVDPLLGPLQKNGGLTRTHALLPGSPALDAIPWGTNGCGTTRYSDQRWQARPQPAGGACDLGAYEVEVPGQALGGWVSGFMPGTVVCQNVTTGQAVTLHAPTIPWDCEAAGVEVRSGDQVALQVRGPMQTGASDVGGAVAGMVPSGGRCTNLTTGQQVLFQALFQGIRGATAASCVAAGLIVHPGDTVQMRVAGAAE